MTQEIEEYIKKRKRKLKGLHKKINLTDREELEIIARINELNQIWKFIKEIEK